MSIHASFNRAWLCDAVLGWGRVGVGVAVGAGVISSGFHTPRALKRKRPRVYTCEYIPRSSVNIDPAITA